MASSNTTTLDSNAIKQSGDYANVLQGTAQNIELSNDLVNIHFSTKGATPNKINLKKFLTYEKTPLDIFNGNNNFLDFTIPFSDKIIHTKDLFFSPTDIPNGKRFSATAGPNSIDIDYTLPQGQYMMDMQIKVNGNIANKNLSALWQTQALHTEQSIKNERQSAFVYFKSNDDKLDYYTIQADKKKELEGNLTWISNEMHYFNSTLIDKNGMNNVQSHSTFSESDSNNVVQNNISFTSNLDASNQLKMAWYMGPNDYNILKKYNMDLEKMIPMGRGIFEFVKYINRWIILPVFQFLSKFISNYGIIIMILTILIRLALSFFTYKSYLSQAKMSALKPELEELKAKIGDDQQKYGVEQMNLYRSAGVNPLGGCLPSLLQLPFLIAMYSFFPASIELRQKSFLWAKDLSTYDSVLHLPFNIPFYGDHISLFTILLTITSLLLALQSSQLTNDQGNPALKYMPYIMPIMFLGFFNNMAAGLTFYYFFSNLISIIQQWVIKNYVIDHDKILAQIQENKKKPATQGKFAQRLAEMQKQNQDRMNKTKK